MGTKILDEDGLLELIRTKPGKKSKYEIAAKAEVGARTILSSVKFDFFPPFVLLRCYRLLCCCNCVFPLCINFIGI